MEAGNLRTHHSACRTLSAPNKRPISVSPRRECSASTTLCMAGAKLAPSTLKRAKSRECVARPMSRDESRSRCKTNTENAAKAARGRASKFPLRLVVWFGCFSKFQYGACSPIFGAGWSYSGDAAPSINTYVSVNPMYHSQHQHDSPMQFLIATHPVTFGLVHGLRSPCISSTFLDAHSVFYRGKSCEIPLTFAIAAFGCHTEVVTFAALDDCAFDILLPTDWIRNKCPRLGESF